jgi:hypothetical protein
MSKRQIIDAIRELNPTAEPTFLAQFDDGDLAQYLQHLRDARAKHVRIDDAAMPSPDVRMVS